MGNETFDKRDTCYRNKRHINSTSDRMKEIKIMRSCVESGYQNGASLGSRSFSKEASSYIVSEPRRKRLESPPTSASDDDDQDETFGNDLDLSAEPLLQSTFSGHANKSHNSSRNSSVSASQKEIRNSQNDSMSEYVSEEETEDPYDFNNENINAEVNVEGSYSRFAPKIHWDVDLKENQLYLRFDGLECGTKDLSQPLGPVARCDSAHRKDKLTFKFCNANPIRVSLQYFSPISAFAKVLSKHISGVKDDSKKVDLFRKKIWSSLHHLKSPAKKCRRPVTERIPVVHNPVVPFEIDAKNPEAGTENSAASEDNINCEDVDISSVPEPIIMRSIDSDIYSKRYVVKDPQANGREVTRFSVHAKKLREPQVLIREVQAEWVEMIKSDIQEESFLVEDCLPCLIRGYNGTIEDFNMSHLAVEQTEVFLETLGGNHIRVALEQLMQQAEASNQPLDHPIFRDVPVSIYFNLTEDECMILARKHNQRLTHKMSWWDEIKLIRQCNKKLLTEPDGTDGRHTTNSSRLQMKVKDILGTQLPTNYPVKVFFASLPEREFHNLDLLINNSSRSFKEGQFPCREFKWLRSEKSINNLFERILGGSSRDKSIRAVFTAMRKGKCIEALQRGISQIVPGNMQIYQIKQRWPQLFDEKEMLRHGAGSKHIVLKPKVKLEDKYLPQPFIRWVRSIACPLQLDIVIPDLRTAVKINGVPLSVEMDPPDERLIEQLERIKESIVQCIGTAWLARSQSTPSANGKSKVQRLPFQK